MTSGQHSAQARIERVSDRRVFRCSPEDTALQAFFPGMVTGNLDKVNNVDPSKVTIELQAPSTDEPPPINFGAPPKNWSGRMASPRPKHGAG